MIEICIWGYSSLCCFHMPPYPCISLFGIVHVQCDVVPLVMHMLCLQCHPLLIVADISRCLLSNDLGLYESSMVVIEHINFFTVSGEVREYIKDKKGKQQRP